jgi:osmotically-inducible protein OsmY
MNIKVIASVAAALGLVSVWPGAHAQSAPTAQAAPADVPADNTKSNAQDSSNKVATADKQTNDSSDLQITKQIRRSLLDDKSLSTYAHNAKIVTVDGTVTLNGVVRSEDEKEAIAGKASQVVGSGRVINDLKVEPKK